MREHFEAAEFPSGDWGWLNFLVPYKQRSGFLRSRCPVLGLLIVMVPLLLVFIIGLALVGAYKMESRSVAASPKWLRLKVFDEAHWQDIKTCIYDTGACDDLVSRTLMLKSYDFSLKKLSSVEVKSSSSFKQTPWENIIIDYPQSS